MDLPELYRLRRRFESHRLVDVGRVTADAVRACEGLRGLRRGDSVAVAVGSRGIAGLADVVHAVVVALREAGAAPFIVPAMGSHGGGTAAGQRACLEGLGIREADLGVEIRATMDVVRVAEAGGRLPLWVGTAAAGAAAVVPVNRIKPHTIFGPPYGSGLAKMLLLGLGNRTGALAVHAAAATRPFESIVRDALPVLLGVLPVPVGVALVEDANHELGMVEALPGEAIVDREPALLDRAAAWMPDLPLHDVDLLIVDEMGKAISGQGMDPHVTGRRSGSKGPRVTRIFVRDLAPGSQGNAHGVGQADATTRRLVRAADWPATWTNTFASGNLDRGRIPPYFDCDRDAITALLGTIGGRGADDARVVRIRNTLALGTSEVSTGCLGALAAPGATDVEAGPYAMPFDDAGNLRPLTD